MSWITVTIIAIFFVSAIGYFIMKRLSLNSLNVTLKGKDYEAVIRLSDTSMCRKLLGDYVCDLYKIRAYVLIKDNDAVRKQARMMLFHEYNRDQHKTFMELYFHIFLYRNDLEMADLFLEEIKKLDDYIFENFNVITYEVLVNKRTDLIQEIEKHIDAKLYSGFPLGTLVYMIAMQYLYMKDYENARTYFEECIICFHPTALYVSLARAQIKKIDDMNVIQVKETPAV